MEAPNTFQNHKISTTSTVSQRIIQDKLKYLIEIWIYQNLKHICSPHFFISSALHEDIKKSVHRCRQSKTIVLTSNKRLPTEKMESPTKPDCRIPPFETIDDFFEYGKKEKYICKNLKRIGKRGDGSKYVCLDKPFEIVPNNCVILSFGINNEWSFDKAISNLGCTVYSFDPFMGREDFDLTSNIHFYNLGISNIKREVKISSKLGKVDRYENILSMLNLIDKKIDYLKMDVEGSEIDFLEDVLSNSVHLLENVKQIGMEIHPLKPPKKDDEETMKRSRFYKLWRYMHQLKCNGFELMRFDPNLVSVNLYTFRNRTESQCYEVVWVKKSSLSI